MLSPPTCRMRSLPERLRYGILAGAVMRRPPIGTVLRAAALLAGPVALAPRRASAQTSADAAAQLRFQHARELFTANRFEEALVEFRATVALVPSPNTRLYIARCLHNLGRNAEALLEYRHAAAEAADRAVNEPRYAATRDVARTEAAAIESSVGQLTIRIEHAPSDLVVLVDGAPVSAALVGIAAPFDPRTYRISARANGFIAREQTVTVQAGRNSDVSIALERDPNARVAVVTPSTSSAPPSAAPPAVQMVTVREGGAVRLAGIGVGALGVVIGVAGTAAFGVMAQSRFDELQRMCAGGCPDMESRIAEGITDRTLANVSLGVGIGLAAVGVVMIAAGGSHEVQRPATARRGGVRIVPTVGGVMGTF